MRPAARIARVLVAMVAFVIAGALSISAAVAVLDYRRTAEWNTFISNAMQADLSARMVTSAIVREVPADGAVPAPDIPQKILHANGVGSEPTPPIPLQSEGLWLVRVGFADDHPPVGDAFPTVSVISVSGSGGAEWSGAGWHRFYVTTDREWAHDLSARMAVFTPGEIVVRIADLPDDLPWYAEFERLGELTQP